MKLEEIKILKDFKLPKKIKFSSDNIIKYIDKGFHGKLLLYNYDNKNISIKITKRYDNKIIFKNLDNEVISKLNINELIILIYFQNSIYSQKVFGYNFDSSKFYIFKEFNKLTMIDYLNNKKINNYDKSLMVLHIFIALYKLYQSNIKGFHYDFCLKNCLVKESKLKSLPFYINNKKFNLPVRRYIPTIIDLENSHIFEYNKKKCFILPDVSFKSYNNRKKYETREFNYYYDLNFFYEFETLPIKYLNHNKDKFYKNILPKDILYVLSDIHDNYGKKDLTVDNIINHKLIKKLYLK